MAFPSTSTEFAMIDARTTSGAFVLPLTTEIPGRIINIKDAYGAFTNSSLTVYTQGGEAFEDGTNFKILNNAWDQLQVYTASTTRWYITGGTEQVITTTNISVVSTLQTFNWPSLCNHANFGYGSTFNPTALGKISFLDNVFTSSTAALASTFIEMGNLNAAPNNMNPGGAFRWLMGVEQDPASIARGLQFKIKRWTSFGMSNSPFFYGANLSTLLDTVNINSLGFVGINNSNPSYLLDVGGPAAFSNNLNLAGFSYGHVKVLPSSNGGEAAIAFYSTTTVNNANLWMLGRSSGFGNSGNLIIGSISNTNVNLAATTTFTPEGRVGIGNNNPAFTLDVNGQTKAFSSIIINTGLPNPAPAGPDLVGADLALLGSLTGAGTLGGYSHYGPHIRSVLPAGSNTDALRLDLTTGRNPSDNVQIPRISIQAISGNVGINKSTPICILDVNGITRSKIPISNITATSLSPTAADYSTHYSLSNTGFNTVTLPVLSGASSNNGWFVVLRNATTVAMSITFTTNACNNIPSPLSLSSSNSITIGYDFTNTVFRAF